MSFELHVTSTPSELGRVAAERAATLIKNAIAQNGVARIVTATGASQFETLAALLEHDIPWEKVEMFHLDEYVALPETHPASFRRYLKERFTSKINLKAAHFISGEGDVAAHIAALTDAVRSAPLDVAFIGIGANGHIAFNDPPADFESDASYTVAALDETCKRQQVGEGWFASLDEVPNQAVTMTVRQIMACRHIVSAVPHAAKARAVRDTMLTPVSPTVPATILKTHPSWFLCLDKASASELICR